MDIGGHVADRLAGDDDVRELEVGLEAGLFDRAVGVGVRS